MLSKWKSFCMKHSYKLLVIIIGVLLCCYSAELFSSVKLDICGTLFDLFETSQFIQIVPFLSCFPYILRIVEEKESGAYLQYLVRYGKGRYVFSRMWRAALSGASIMLEICVIFLIVLLIYAKVKDVPVSMAASAQFQPLPGKTDTVSVMISRGGEIRFFFLCMFGIALFGAVFPCIGAGVSFLVQNKRFLLVFPFLLMTVLIYALPDQLYMLNPNVLAPNFFWMNRNPWELIAYMLGEFTVLFVFFGVILFIGVERYGKGRK